MAGGQVMYSQASKIQRRLSPYLPISIRPRYSEGSKTDQIKKSTHGNLIDEERAHSTAEVFRKVAEEKTSRRGVVEKVDQSVSETETLKETYKKPPENVNSG